MNQNNHAINDIDVIRIIVVFYVIDKEIIQKYKQIEILEFNVVFFCEISHFNLTTIINTKFFK